MTSDPQPFGFAADRDVNESTPTPQLGGALLTDAALDTLIAQVGDRDHFRLLVEVLILAAAFDGQSQAIRDDAQRLADTDGNPVAVHGFRHRANLIEADRTAALSLFAQAAGYTGAVFVDDESAETADPAGH